MGFCLQDKTSGCFMILVIFFPLGNFILDCNGSFLFGFVFKEIVNYR